MSYRYSDIENALHVSDISDDDGNDLPEVDIPDPTPSQMVAMGDFIKAPSKEGWLELVEQMIKQREEEAIEKTIEQYSTPQSFSERERETTSSSSEDSRPETPPRRSPRSPPPNRPRRSDRKSPRKSVIPESHTATKERSIIPESPTTTDASTIISKPDPPSEYEDDYDMIMGGWTMHASSTTGKHYDEEADLEVSEQLKSMLDNSNTPINNTVDTDETNSHASSAGTGSTRCTYHYKLRRPPLRAVCIFLLGIAVGIGFIVGGSFAFEGTSDDLREIALRTHGSRHHIEDSLDGDTTGSDEIEIPEDEMESEKEETVEDATANEADIAFQQEDNASEASEEEEEELDLDIADFCWTCQWKYTNFNCKKRVEWEMEFYKISEELAMSSNLKHCINFSSADGGR